MKIKKKILIIFLLLAVAVGTVYFLHIKNSLRYQLYKEGITIERAKGFAIAERSQDTIIAKKDNEIIKIKILRDYDQKKANEAIKSQTVSLQQIFNPQLPPYPEFLKQENSCSEKYYPIKKETDNGSIYTLFSNDRFGYGVCADDLIAYKAGLGLFYCPKKRVFARLEFFTDPTTSKNDVESFMTSFACN